MAHALMHVLEPRPYIHVFREPRPHIHVFRYAGRFSFEPGDGSIELVYRCRCGALQSRNGN